ncbi:CofH family radical SAM protein [Candidatus Saganbacteria bacterium]|nr:CofH family radical SAM protein [Candidatus Saganbacteria bacterium]
MIDRILEKGSKGLRLSLDEALKLAAFKDVDQVHALGKAAMRNRLKRFSRNATFVLNLMVNPSNICDSQCKFCHYHALENDPTAYTMSKKEILGQVSKYNLKEVHITGGMNKHWPYKKSLELISSINKLYPALYIKAYTAVEIDRFANDEKRSVEGILTELKQAGLNSLTGGGAELFSTRMRAKYCPNKISPETWISIHHLAHKLGIRSNATMLYGLDETDEEIVDHLIALRDAQDASEGFSCFIPLAYQPSTNDRSGTGPSPLENLRMVALSRLLLDNFAHIKAYWPMIGVDTAAAALSWGADDLDGTLGKERIAHSGLASSPESLSRNMMIDIIKFGGFIPAERDGNFNEQ